tara:strand:+ start:4544 stop:4933 length:390 start_codon:yes stop_codon:yes gene_type:complete
VIRFLVFTALLFFIQSCSSSRDILDYETLNQRFEYSSAASFKNSIISHFHNETNQFDKKLLENLEILNSTNNDLILFRENIDHELLIEKFPNKIYNFLLYLKANNASEKIIFETMQAYLRYLTKNTVLR